MENNRQYSLADLLEDESFIAFANHPNPEGEAEWRLRISEGRVSEKDFRMALFCVSFLHSDQRSVSSGELSSMWSGVQSRIRSRRRARWCRIFAATSIAAACLIAAVWIALLRLNPSESLDELQAMPRIEEVPLPPQESDDIQIVFSDNNCLSLKEKTAHIQYNDQGVAEINSQTLVPPDEQSKKSQEPVFNQVIVPKGRHTFLALSDGTRIWLNASSRLVYPPVFQAAVREVFLEGEAYVEVKSDANRPFVVKTGIMEVTATGTAFNVAAYKDEQAQSVVLVTGAVSVQTASGGKNSARLSPNQMFCLSDGKSSLSTVKVERYISWKEGVYIYSDEKLSRILNRLSHYYGISISCEPEAGELKFSGKLDLKTDPERVLRGFSNTAPVAYKHENNSYIIYMNH